MDQRNGGGEGGLAGVMCTSGWPRWYGKDTMINETAIPHKHTSIRQLAMVLVVWSNLCDHSVNVTLLG